MARELPVIDVSRCSRCGDCIAVCPRDCLASQGRLIWLPRPLDCISCAACREVCPDQAITLRQITEA